MKHLLLTTITLLAALTATAQKTDIEKYELVPDDYMHVFLDCVKYNPSRIITTQSGQYVGQVNDQNLLYGYGMFVGDNGGQIIGQFRDGKLLFGITISKEAATVGTANYHANYSLTTGRMEYILQGEQKQILDTEHLYDYGFVSIRYQNGDQYVGELYQRRRHGYGIYYYANGDIWFGQYRNDARQGFGVLFDKDNNLVIGQWDGEDVRRQIYVVPDKKKKR